MVILDEIVEQKRHEIASAKALRPFEALQKEAENFRPARRPFRALFDRGPVLIAEIKPRSPSAGELTGAPLDVADLYAKSEADAISVLTDRRYFGGSLELLKEVRARVPQAVLRKDFIVDEYQVYETFLSGADAFLLIASILGTNELSEYIAIAQALELDYLVEVHDGADLEKAMEVGADLIGINNRDLKTMETSIEATRRLAPVVPHATPVVSESGFESAADVRKVREWGARGILAGTSILRSSDPLQKIQEFKASLAI